MKIFQERIKELRKNKRISQKQLAEVMNTSNSSICDWECGRSQPDLETLCSLSVYFDVTTDYLLGLEDETGSKIKFNS